MNGKSPIVPYRLAPPSATKTTNMWGNTALRQQKGGGKDNGDGPKKGAAKKMQTTEMTKRMMLQQQSITKITSIEDYDSGDDERDWDTGGGSHDDEENGKRRRRKDAAVDPGPGSTANKRTRAEGPVAVASRPNKTTGGAAARATDEEDVDGDREGGGEDDEFATEDFEDDARHRMPSSSSSTGVGAQRRDAGRSASLEDSCTMPSLPRLPRGNNFTIASSSPSAPRQPGPLGVSTSMEIVPRGKGKSARNKWAETEEDATKRLTEYDRIKGCCLFFMRLADKKRFKMMMQSNLRAAGGEAITQFTVDNRGLHAYCISQGSARILEYTFDVKSFTEFYTSATEGGTFYFTTRSKDLLDACKMADAASPMVVYCVDGGQDSCTVNGRVTIGRIRLHFERSNTGVSDDEVKALDDSGSTYGLKTNDEGVMPCIATLSIPGTSLSEQARKYGKASWTTVCLKIRREVIRARAAQPPTASSSSSTAALVPARAEDLVREVFFLNLETQKDTMSHCNKWSLSSSRGQILDVKMADREQLAMEGEEGEDVISAYIYTDSFNMISDLLPFWENVVMSVTRADVKVDMRFDNENAGVGRLTYIMSRCTPSVASG